MNSQASAHFRLGNIYEKTNRKELARGEYEDDAKRALDGVR